MRSSQTEPLCPGMLAGDQQHPGSLGASSAAEERVRLGVLGMGGSGLKHRGEQIGNPGEKPRDNLEEATVWAEKMGLVTSSVLTQRRFNTPKGSRMVASSLLVSGPSPAQVEAGGESGRSWWRAASLGQISHPALTATLGRGSLPKVLLSFQEPVVRKAPGAKAYPREGLTAAWAWRPH